MILVYINSTNGISKASFEAVTYAKKLGDVIALSNGSLSSDELAHLGAYGASKVLVDRNVSGDDQQQVTRMIAEVASSNGVNTVVFSHDLHGKSIAPMLSVSMKAGLVQGAISLPDADGCIDVNVFSGKAIGKVKVNSSNKIISLLPNSLPPEDSGATCAVEEVTTQAGNALIKVLSNFFFARDNTRIPFYISFFSVFLNVLISLIYFKKIGFIIIPIATSISTWSAVLIYVIVLLKLKYFNIKNIFFINMIKILISSLIMSLGLYYLLGYFEDKLIYSNYYKSFYLIMIIVLNAGIYLLLARLLGALKIKNFITDQK